MSADTTPAPASDAIEPVERACEAIATAGVLNYQAEIILLQEAVRKALASPAPAPPAVEAQGAVTLARFTPTPSGLMMWDKYGEWVDRSDCMRALASEKARADRLEAAHDATCNVLADTERRRMNAEAELAKLREALLEISSMHLAEGEDDDREGLSALLSRIRVRALRPTTSKEGMGE